MFGALEAVGILYRISRSVVRIIRRHLKHHNVWIFSYLDNFFCIADSERVCQMALDCLVETLCNLGFSINWDKYVSPTQCIIFLKIEIDAIKGII